ncbi:hypothetical protein Y1Q_0013481 [Alligator mississippiensis]|uniref:Uncharacterized protein n=1 Tax=Alligator mississippiensis TaxID=8496 RepID=A0A151P3B2_ALLMI|nr:hypothetical protein Y1Q_0013481 [Alligator mississippiensis]
MGRGGAGLPRAFLAVISQSQSTRPAGCGPGPGALPTARSAWRERLRVRRRGASVCAPLTDTCLKRALEPASPCGPKGNRKTV